MSTNYKEVIKAEVADLRNVRDEYKGMTADQLHEVWSTATNPFAVCVLNCTGSLNIGMIARSASLFGAEEVLVFGRRKFDSRSLVGANNYMKINKYYGFCDDSSDELDLAKFKLMLGTRYIPLFIEGPGYRMLNDINWSHLQTYSKNIDEKFVLVFGNEGDGIPKNFIEHYGTGHCISIPQQGVLRSLNVSAAAAIVLYTMCEKLGWL